ncbi:MAG: hypothetical protein L3K01_05600, partial [Thermoplasmata archaeon]|nr:hypothetical protein [Thermoplasmata archaeon]
VTILDVPVSSGQVDVNATFVASLSIATVIVFTANAADTVVLNGSNYSGFAVAVLPVGSYPISYVAGPGAQFSTWLGGGSEIMTNFSSTSRVTFEAGTSTIEASDYAIQLVTLNDSGGNGTIAWSPDTNWGSVAIPSGTTIPVNISEATYPRFTLVATPGPGEAFAGWTINNTALGFFANRMSYDTTVTFNSTGVSPVGITAHYVTGGRANLYVHLSPSAGAGILQIGFAAVPVSSGSVPSATGNVYVVVGANSGFVVTGLTADNGSTVHLVQSASAVTRPWAPWVWVVDIAGNTSLNATFRTLTYPVTFVADWAGGSPTATINGSTVGQGETIWLPNGTYSLSATLGSGVTFLSWSPSWSDLNVSAPGSLTTTFNVTGPGTLYALGSIPNGPIVVLSVLSPTSVNLRPGGSADVNATAYCLRGSCPSANLTFAWTLTNSAAGSLNVTTGAQVRFTAANVDANSELIVNATLNGTTVESAPASIAVVPALTGVTLTPSSGSIYAGQSVGIVPTLSCTANVTCPLGATITPSLGSPSLGFLGSNLTYPVTFTSYPGEFGTENISVQVSLNGVTLTPVVAVEVALPLLVGVTVAPTPVSTPVGGSALVSATAGCSAGLGCPAGVQFTWTFAPTTLGALSSSTGSTIQFTAATTAGTGTLTAAGTLNGVTISSAAVPVTVTPSTVVVTLVSVTISPATLSIAVGSSGQFTAAVACSPDPCPSGVSVAWTLTGNVGTLSNPEGSSTNLSAAFAGSGSLYANGTLNGKTISAIPASVTVPSSGGSTSNSTPVYDSPLLWVAVVVIAVVLIAAYMLMRRGPSEGTPTPPAGANAPDTPK